MIKLFTTLCGLLISLVAWSANFKAAGDSAYMRGSYVEAIAHYDSALAQGHNAAVYQNQGNAYYRLEQYPKAILAYERGLRYAPGNNELSHSLLLATTKLPERLRSSPPFVTTTWYHQALLALSVTQWTIAAIITLSLALGLLLIYFLSRPIVWRKIGFFGSLALCICFFWSLWATFALRSYLTTHPTAIVMQRTPAADSPSGQSTGNAFVPVGTKVEITDRSIPKYWRVTLPDGKSVWVAASDVALI